MKRSLLFSPMLMAVALFPALLQGSPDCNPPTGNATLLSLELEAGGLNRVVDFQSSERLYNVWFDVPATVTLRVETTDLGSTVQEGSTGNLIPFGDAGGGEVTLDIPTDLTDFLVFVVAPGGAVFTYTLHINPPCSPGDCNDADSCTSDACNTGTSTCEFTVLSDGASCDGGNGTCQSSVCIDNCDGVDCSDGTPCTLDVCDSASGGTCSNPPGPAGPVCDAGGGPDTGQCDGLGGCPPIDPLCLAPVMGTVPTACRESFSQKVLNSPVDMTIVFDRCLFAGQPFTAHVTPTIAIDQGYLQRAVEVLCAIGIDLCELGLIVPDAQVEVDALAGATCTPQLSELPGTPVIVPLSCSSGCTVPVLTAPVAIALPEVSVSCTAGAAPGPVGMCAVGTTPPEAFFAPTGTQDVDTWAEVDLMFPHPVSLQCGDGMPSSPDIPCTDDSDCAAIVGNDGSVSTCDLGAPPNFCTTVPLDLDPTVDCITVPIAP